MSRKIKFRAWDNENNRYYEPIHEAYKGRLETLMVNMNGDLMLHTMQGVAHESTFPDRFILEQFTGLKDKNGKDIFEGDLLKIKRTLHDGKYKSEAIYRVSFGQLGGIELTLESLFDNGDTENQIPIDQTLCEKYRSLDLWYENDKLTLISPDTWGENHISCKRWKSSDKTSDIEVIGNIHENPEVLR